MINFLRVAGVISATILGAGMFALPYVFVKSGWTVGVFYLITLGAMTIFAHVLYWRTLDTSQGRETLLGLARNKLGKFGYYAGFFSILVGLVLALVIYLILGVGFIKLFVPGINTAFALLAFWLAGVLPLLFTEKRILWFEILGIFFIGSIIFIIFISALPISGGLNIPSFDAGNIFLPFGAILFALAGWTAIEPLYWENRDAGGVGGAKVPAAEIFVGTAAVCVLYILFIWGIFGSAASVTPDTLSGLGNWPFWKTAILGALGLFALLTSYVPISLEIKNTLAHNLGLSVRLSLAIVIFLPLILVFAGLNNFLGVMGLAGGVFLSLQYILIALVGQKVLEPRGFKKFLIFAIVGIFLFAAVYETHNFIVR